MARTIHSLAKKQREQRKQLKRREKAERRLSRSAEKLKGQGAPEAEQPGAAEGSPEPGAGQDRPA